MNAFDGMKKLEKQHFPHTPYDGDLENSELKIHYFYTIHSILKD